MLFHSRLEGRLLTTTRCLQVFYQGQNTDYNPLKPISFEKTVQLIPKVRVVYHTESWFLRQLGGEPLARYLCSVAEGGASLDFPTRVLPQDLLTQP